MIFALIVCSGIGANAQFNRVAMDRDYIISLTSSWEGERLPDGRPYVSDNLLERLKKVVYTHAWGAMMQQGFNNQYQSGWTMINPDKNTVMTGRVVTAQYMPLRPDFGNLIREVGLAEGHKELGGSNSWPIEMLVDGDVYVADCFGKIAQGTLIGDRLASGIHGKSNRGIIFWGSVRNIQQIKHVDGFNGWILGQDLSWLQEVMLTSINAPIRIGQVTVLPGDVVLASEFGTLFIPAYLVQKIIFSAEMGDLRHKYGIMRVRNGDWHTGQIDSRWTDEMVKELHSWINSLSDSELPMPRKEFDDYLKE